MKVLIACEESQEVCKAFRARGHEAYSCGVQEPSGGHPEWHIFGDALKALNGGRREKSLKMHGCNYFGKTTTRSTPFAIFDRQDVLQLALDLDVPIPAEYGEIAKDKDGKLYTTKAQRTGCTMCGFGIHIEGRPHRFDILRETNPKEWEF